MNVRLMLRRAMPVVAVVGLAAGAMMVGMYTETDGMGSGYRSGPGSASAFRVGLTAAGFEIANVGADLGALMEHGQGEPGLFVMVGPSGVVSPTERDLLERFVERGGRALIAAESTDASIFGRPHGVHFAGFALASSEGLDPSHVRVDIDGGTLQGTFITDSPTFLYVDADARGSVLGWTARDAFMDLNGNTALDSEDQLGPFPVVYATERNDRGGLFVFVADVDAFTDRMADRPGQVAAMTDLVRSFLRPGQTVIMDERGKDDVAARAGASRVVSVLSLSLAQPAFALAALGLVVLVTWRALRAAPPPLPPEHRFRPDMDVTLPEALERLAGSMRSPVQPAQPDPFAPAQESEIKTRRPEAVPT